SRLEYRGYDSAGIATLDPDLRLKKVEGPVGRLGDLCRQMQPEGVIGIAHTRWATHGEPSAVNAHPHRAGKIAVIHNGIIENHSHLRAELEDFGAVFESRTDTEVIPHLVESYRAAGATTVEAVKYSMGRLEGRFAFAVLCEDEPDQIVAARQGSPLVVGRSAEGSWLSSDDAALSDIADEVAVLEDGDVVTLRRDGIEFGKVEGEVYPRLFQKLEKQTWQEPVGEDDDYTSREMLEQPEALARTLRELRRTKLDIDAKAITRVHSIACGSSHYAACLAAPWFEKLARLPMHNSIASECRDMALHDPKRSLNILVSQSGETADTLTAQSVCKAADHQTMAVVNIGRSQMARDADHVWLTRAGREFGVAATKTFTCQTAALALLAVRLARKRKRVPAKTITEAANALNELPEVVKAIQPMQARIEVLAKRFAKAQSALFLGRGGAFPAAAEGALKLKELSYIHAEAYPAGELKHGPIAVISEGMPVVISAPSDAHWQRSIANMQEVKARGAWTILITDEGVTDTDGADEVIILPKLHPLVAPIAQVLVMQMLAYHTAKALDLNVDRPRNLAKSVTVE
ncbi:MAG: glutamine--fructose-6-phosphate transaminase (isomerizing), partial [Geminicoccaceae bacterium]